MADNGDRGSRRRAVQLVKEAKQDVEASIAMRATSDEQIETAKREIARLGSRKPRRSA